MAAKNRKKIMDLSIESEGTFSTDRGDPGNYTGGKVGVGEFKGTKYGIAANTYGHLDIKNLTRAQAVQIYTRDFWNMIGGDQLPSGIDYAVFDYAINSGVARAVRELQAIVGARVDGILGDSTRNALNAWIKKRGKNGVQQFLHLYLAARWEYMKGRKTFNKHKGGWKIRIDKVLKVSLSMAANDNSYVNVPANFPVARAIDQDQSVTRAVTKDATGKGISVATASTMGAVISESADRFESLTHISEIAVQIFIALTIISLGITIYLRVKK